MALEKKQEVTRTLWGLVTCTHEKWQLPTFIGTRFLCSLPENFPSFVENIKNKKCFYSTLNSRYRTYDYPKKLYLVSFSGLPFQDIDCRHFMGKYAHLYLSYKKF